MADWFINSTHTEAYCAPYKSLMRTCRPVTTLLAEWNHPSRSVALLCKAVTLLRLTHKLFPINLLGNFVQIPLNIIVVLALCRWRLSSVLDSIFSCVPTLTLTLESLIFLHLSFNFITLPASLGTFQSQSSPSLLSHVSHCSSGVLPSIRAPNDLRLL